MKKIHMFAALLAMLLPTVVFATTTTYYAALKAQVSSNSSGMGKVYAGTSNSAPSASSYNASSSTSGTQSSSTKDDTSKKGYAFAQANDGYEFVGWSTSDNGSSVSTANPYTVSLTCSSTTESSPTLTTVYANFKKKVLAAFSITFETSANGTYTVDGAAPANKTGLTEATSVVLNSTDANFLNWKVNGTVISDNPYTATCLADTTISAEFLTPDQVTTVTTLSDLTAALSNAAYRKVLIPAGTEIVMTSGTASVPSDKQLVVDGALWVEGGSFTSSGKVVINGTFSKSAKLIQQVGNNGQPFNPYTGDDKYQVKYWKTSATTPSATISGVSASSHISIVNGAGETVYRGASANAYVCKTDKSIAINHITSVKASYSSGTDAYNAVAKNSHNVSLATCNLMGSAASELVLLTANGTVNVGSSTALSSGFIADCAGNNISFTSKQFGNAANVIAINGATVTSSKLTNARLTAINCATVTGAGTDGINNNQASYYTSLHLYDCTSFSRFNFSASAVMTGGTPGVCFFSGGPYNPSFTGNYHVYGGTFSKDPTNYLASNDLEAPKEGNYWVVRVKKPTIYVAKVGATQYESLQEAVNAAAGGTVELLPGIATEDLSSPVTVASGKTVTIDLAGYAVTAPNGAIVNNGTLYLQDTSTFDVPGSLTTAGGNVIVNNGTLDVTYGAYTGNILLNGGTFTTHFGTFDGTISVANGLDPKVVANLRGGEFSDSVSSFLRDGYSEVYSHMGQNDPMRYWVVQYLTIVTPTSYSSTEKAWKLDFMSSSDLVIYKRTKSRSDHSSLADWQRRAELHSHVQPYSQYVLDCALIFDCPVAAGSVTFYGKAQVSMSESVGKDLAANEDFPALAHRIYEMNYTPLSYGRYIDEVGSVTAGVKNNSNANVGTVCTMDLRICTQSKNTPGVYDKLKALVDVRYMLGGKKAAIDRGASRLAYDSLAAAVSAVQDGERVLVGADTAENVTLPNAAGEYIIDPYGFAFTGTVTAPEGLTVTSEEVASLATAQGVENAKAVKYTVAVPPSIATVDGAELASWDAVVAAVNAAGGSSVAVVVTAPLTESLTLAAGKTLTVSIADGVEATVAVTPVSGAFLVTSTADGATTYAAKQITVVMAEPAAGSSVAVTRIENGEEADVTDAADVGATLALIVGNSSVPLTDNTDSLDVLDLITVTPTKIIQKVAGAKTFIRSASFDVVPSIKAGKALAEGQALKFRLPVDPTATQLAAVVRHAGVFFDVLPVRSEGGEKFLEVSSSDFSPYSYELLDGETTTPAAAIGTTGYATLADALSALREGDRLVLLAAVAAPAVVAVPCSVETNGFAPAGSLAPATGLAVTDNGDGTLTFRRIRPVILRIADCSGRRATAPARALIL